jgi:hypothetical protein
MDAERNCIGLNSTHVVKMISPTQSWMTPEDAMICNLTFLNKESLQVVTGVF